MIRIEQLVYCQQLEILGRAQHVATLCSVWSFSWCRGF